MVVVLLNHRLDGRVVLVCEVVAKNEFSVRVLKFAAGFTDADSVDEIINHSVI